MTLDESMFPLLLAVVSNILIYRMCGVGSILQPRMAHSPPQALQHCPLTTEPSNHPCFSLETESHVAQAGFELLSPSKCLSTMPSSLPQCI